MTNSESRDRVICIREEKLDGEQLIRREQIAAQVVAVMQSHFSRPGPQEMQEILRCAESQVSALKQPQTFPLS